MAALEVGHGPTGERAEDPVDPEVGEREHGIKPTLGGRYQGSFAADLQDHLASARERTRRARIDASRHS